MQKIYRDTKVEPLVSQWDVFLFFIKDTYFDGCYRLLNCHQKLADKNRHTVPVRIVIPNPFG